MLFARRKLLETAGAALAGAVVSPAMGANAPMASVDEFSIDATFAQFMRDIGGSAEDAGGRVTFTGRDPILRSHFRLGTCMAVPTMAAGVGAAAIWRERTGQTQDLSIDLRQALWGIAP